MHEGVPPPNTHAHPIATGAQGPKTHSAHNQGGRMSTLIAIAYPDAATAEEVRAQLVQATKERLIQLEDAVVVEHRPDGKIKLHQAMSPAGTGAAGGAVWGGLIGLLFLAPVVGMAVGAAAGGPAGKAPGGGGGDNLLKDPGAQLPPRAPAPLVAGG